MMLERLSSHRTPLHPVSLFVLAVAIVVALIAGGLSAFAQETTGFDVGESVAVATDGLNLRTEPTTDAEILTVLPPGALGEVADGPVDADGHGWYNLIVEGFDGWVAGEYLASGAASAFTVGSAVVVITDALNVRDDASLDAAVADILVEGATATVLDGPVSADGYDWYQLDAGGVVGWAVRDYLALASDAADFAAGAEAIVSDPEDEGLNLRDTAGLDGSVLALLANGSSVAIVSGPVVVDGYTWYEVSADLGDGWVAGEFLALAP